MYTRTFLPLIAISLTTIAVAPISAAAESASAEVRLAARPLPLSDVRLTGGPLKHAQDLDAEYLLKLEPDRMLAYYRIRAGLQPKAKPYGGWDGDGKNLTGHICGHYLSAVSLMWAATGDARFKQRADYIVRELKEVQDRHGNGYLGALADGERHFAEVARGDIRSGSFDLNGLWSPWYVFHKMFAGLRDAYRYTGNRTALELETKFAAWAEDILAKLDDKQLQTMLGTEFGGMNEVLADLYADTGEKRWLALADRFHHRAIVDPLARHEDVLPGKHGNTQVPKLLGSLIQYLYSGSETDGAAARFFWDQVVDHHSFCTGGHGKDEYFGPPDKLNAQLDGRTAETCNVYNMLKLTRRLFALQPDIRYAEFHERALFNHILGSIDPQDGRMCYMVPVGLGAEREYQNMFDDFTCCVGTGMESHALHGDGIYYEAKDRLWVNLYVPSTAQWKAAGVKLALETDLPEGESASLKLSLERPRRFTLALRRPLWADKGFSVSVSGSAMNNVPAAGSYVELDRTWHDGDRVTLVLPKTLRLEPLPDNKNRFAIFWGPLVLAGDMGGELTGSHDAAPASTKESKAPALAAAGQPVENWLKPLSGKPGNFRTEGVGRERDVTFVPFYRLHHRPYAVYWDLLTPEQFKDRAAAKAHIKIDLKQEKAPVSPTLYGIFMEEISHAFDGGIYGELIQNRSFAEGLLPPGMKTVKKPDGGLKMELEKLPPGVPKDRQDMPWPWMMNCGWDPNRALIGWSLEPRAGGKGTMKLTDEHPLNAAAPRSLELTVAAKGEQCVDLINSGYWGINVQKGTTYALKFYVRAGTYRGTVTASLLNKDGKELARHDFAALQAGDGWQKLSTDLKATGSDSSARFSLRFCGEGTLQVNWVSLFPPTYKDRPNGLRPDLAKYLEELKPAFIRYPGGCYVEGLSWQSAPDWRKMVCPPEERPGMWGYWQYRSTDGFGYDEYLQFCEDIGADAMYVVFAGMTVHPENNIPLDQIDPVIQQALDAIEYALGPVDSKWGAVRAKMGHPEPYPLKYVEIGNEHPPAIYGDYYARFRKAIKARWPQITVVMSMYWSGLNYGAIERAGDNNIDIVDEHAYRPSGWARSNWEYFDRYPRKSWKVYLGEYAHHHGGGDFSGAMDDSVFLMMMERNGDLVKMASYAPLFCNVNKRDWGINLIEFDASRSFAHASYYVQKVFNETRPDVNLATTVDFQPKPDLQKPLLAGRFGLGSWNTLNEFKEFRIYDENGTLVISDDFASLDHWETPGVGQWKAEGSVLKQTDSAKSPAKLLLKREFKTGRITLKARRVGGNEGFLMFFHADGPERYMFCNYGAAGNAFSAIQGTPAEGLATQGGGDLQGPIESNRWYDITLVLTRNSAEMLLDGKRVSRVEAQQLPDFFATAGYDRGRQLAVVRATNYRAQSVAAEIELAGEAKIAPLGRHITIRSKDLYAENSLEEPVRIIPQELPLQNCAQRFTVSLPPYSVNVLLIPAVVEKQAIRAIAPPEKGFFSKRIDYEGIPIKAHRDVDDAALFHARARLEMMLARLPDVRKRLAESGAELHIIGRNQVTSDLPEFRRMRGKRFDGSETIDERTRGMGGVLSSCGEENLLRLDEDRYRGRDICVHEFAHCIQDHGMTDAQREEFSKQYRESLAAGKWVDSYAASNEGEFFAELSMWFFGTHGDMGMKGPKPAVGPVGLKIYDPQAYELFETFYNGRLTPTP